MSKPRYKHASWDGGSISAMPLLVAVLGYQKTIKTKCSKRVPFAQIDNHDITCGLCLDEINREVQSLARLEQYSHVLETQGHEAANELVKTWDNARVR